MTKTQQYEVDFINSKLILTKKFYKAATILNTPEYTTLMQLRRDNPGFTIELRTIRKKEGKKTYHGSHSGTVVHARDQGRAKKHL